MSEIWDRFSLLTSEGKYALIIKMKKETDKDKRALLAALKGAVSHYGIYGIQYKDLHKHLFNWKHNLVFRVKGGKFRITYTQYDEEDVPYYVPVKIRDLVPPTAQKVIYV